MAEKDKPPAPKAGRFMITTPKRSRPKVLGVGNCLLRGAKASICQPDLISWEVCHLPGVRIRDVMERLPRPICPSDHEPMLLSHMGTNEIARSIPGQINSDYRALGAKVKESGTQVVSSSIFPVQG